MSTDEFETFWKMTQVRKTLKHENIKKMRTRGQATIKEKSHTFGTFKVQKTTNTLEVLLSELKNQSRICGKGRSRLRSFPF